MEIQIKTASGYYAATYTLPVERYSELASLSLAVNNGETVNGDPAQELVLLLDGLANWEGDVPETFSTSNQVEITPLCLDAAWELADIYLGELGNLSKNNPDVGNVPYYYQNAQASLVHHQAVVAANPNSKAHLDIATMAVRIIRANLVHAFRLLYPNAR